MLERVGERYFFSSVTGLLAEVLALLGHDTEAMRCAEIAREVAKVDDFFAQVLWRRTMARVLARRDELAEAERLAREALEIASATDDLNTRGACALVLADVLRAAGRDAEAVDAIQRAIAEYQQKGNVVMAERAHALLGELGGEASASATTPMAHRETARDRPPAP